MHYRDEHWTMHLDEDWEHADSVQMLAANDVWAAGDRHGRGNEDGFILHYNGQVWQEVATFPNSQIQRIHMSATGEGWAIAASKIGGGQYGIKQDRILHCIAGKWQEMDNPVAGVIAAVWSVSASEAWAVGMGGLILHYLDNRWTQVDSPTGLDLLDIQMLSANEGWIVGGTGWSTPTQQTVALRYHTGQWQPIETPDDVRLERVSMTSADEGWVLANGKRGSGFVFRFSKGIWQRHDISLAHQGPRYDIAVGHDEGWIVGVDGPSWHYYNGEWQEYRWWEWEVSCSPLPRE